MSNVRWSPLGNLPLSHESMLAISLFALPIKTEYHTINDVVQSLSAVEQILLTRGDRRAIFVTAYLDISREIQRRVKERFFQDNYWVTQYCICFANLYREALYNFECGHIDAVPEAWRISFNTAIQGNNLVIQDLILGINAHINHDLPFALTKLSIDPERDKRYLDHTTVNQVLEAAAATVKARVSSMYSPILRMLGYAMKNLDNDIASFSVRQARDRAWENAVKLATVQNEQERSEQQKRIDREASILARSILAMPRANPFIRRTLEELAKITPLWKYAHTPTNAEEKPALVPLEPLSGLDDAIKRLKALIVRFDSQHSQLSVYPSFYLHFLQRVRNTLATGTIFENGPWIIKLNLQLIARYLSILHTFETAQEQELAQCWQVALHAINNRRTTVLQALILMLNAQLQHDFVLALLHIGLNDDAAHHSTDLATLFKLFKEEFQPIPELLVHKYSEAFDFTDLIRRTLDTLLTDFDAQHMWKKAWANAVWLSNLPSTQEQQQEIDKIDQQATLLAQKLLLRTAQYNDWVVPALRRIEITLHGPRSSWILRS